MSIHIPRLWSRCLAHDVTVLGPPFHFRVTSCRIDSGNFCTAALLVIKIKIKRYVQYCNIYFEKNDEKTPKQYLLEVKIEDYLNLFKKID